ncbi:hypothetical protein [Cognatishimia maritima]|nr:hypothetical protein [Cognatishimia maritima]
MKGRKGMNLLAVIAAVVFMLVYAVPTLRGAHKAEDCAAEGGRWVHSEGFCER